MKDKLLDSKNRLEHMIEAIIAIEKFSKNEDSVSFCENEMLNNSILLQFIIIGEAIVHVEDRILKKYDYPWYKIRSFRNMIAHEYFNIKLPAVWEIIQKDLPELKTILQQVLAKEF